MYAYLLCQEADWTSQQGFPNLDLDRWSLLQTLLSHIPHGGLWQVPENLTHVDIQVSSAVHVPQSHVLHKYSVGMQLNMTGGEYTPSPTIEEVVAHAGHIRMFTLHYFLVVTYTWYHCNIHWIQLRRKQVWLELQLYLLQSLVHYPSELTFSVESIVWFTIWGSWSLDSAPSGWSKLVFWSTHSDRTVKATALNSPCLEAPRLLLPLGVGGRSWWSWRSAESKEAAVKHVALYNILVHIYTCSTRGLHHGMLNSHHFKFHPPLVWKVPLTFSIACSTHLNWTIMYTVPLAAFMVHVLALLTHVLGRYMYFYYRRYMYGTFSMVF